MKAEETMIDKVLKEALWRAYCDGRANNKYIPEEVVPELIKRLNLPRSPDNPEGFGESRLLDEPMMLLQTQNGGSIIVDTTPANKLQDAKTASIKSVECDARFRDAATVYLKKIDKLWDSYVEKLHEKDAEYRRRLEEMMAFIEWLRDEELVSEYDWDLHCEEKYQALKERELGYRKVTEPPLLSPEEINTIRNRSPMINERICKMDNGYMLKCIQDAVEAQRQLCIKHYERI